MRLSSLLSVALFVYFTVLCILYSLNDDILTEPAIFDEPIPLGCAAAFFFLVVAVQARDRTRRRFTHVQRVFHSLAVLLLTLGVVFRVALDDQTKPAALDVTSLVAVLVYAGLALCECRILPYPALAAKDQKARLSFKAVLTVLKPYFWPDATAHSAATLNRIRAMATWAFVVGSKATGLLAPIYIGRAATALAELDYSAVHPQRGHLLRADAGECRLSGGTVAGVSARRAGGLCAIGGTLVSALALAQSGLALAKETGRGGAQHGPRHSRLRHPHQVPVSVDDPRRGRVHSGGGDFCHVL